MTEQQPAKQQNGSTIGGCLVLLLVIGWAVSRFGGEGDRSGSGGSTTNAGAEPAKTIVGTFLSWDPVDDARGYAYFTVTNRGSTSAEATCTVQVRNDFGNFGFDFMAGDRLEPGETKRLKMGISVGDGSFLINEGSVKDC